MTAPTLCDREGCTRHAVRRGKCISHHTSMMKSLRRQGSTLYAMVDTWAVLQQHMPASLRQLEARSGITYNTIMKTINKRYDAGQAHVVKYLPPQQHGGSRWVKVFAAGPGIDVQITEKRKRNHMLKMRRERSASMRLAEEYARQAAAEAAARAAEAAALAKIKARPATRWNLAFFNPAEIRA